MKSQEKPKTDKTSKTKVFAGLSGGVDSSVSAALLKAATPNNFSQLFGRPTPEGFSGYDVTGVFIKVWQPNDDSPSTSSGQLHATCNWREDRLDAMRVCAKLEIPFITLDLSKEYKKEVVDYMIAEYRVGRTPNPDVMCNRYVKFGGFFKWAMAQGADYVATGHYARAEAAREFPISNSQFSNNGNCNIENSLKIENYKLKISADLNKDQSYFLWTLTQEQLAHTLFPVGGMEKPEVRKLAEKFGLPTASKKDSQGLCFIGKIDVKEFLKSFIKTKPGKVLDENGKVIGDHDGATFFTLGERHGFTIRSRVTGEKSAYYVISKDIQKNTITVSHKLPEGGLANAVTEVIIKDSNWTSGKPLSSGKVYYARARYRQALQKARIVNYESRVMDEATHQKNNSSIIHNSKFIIRFASAQSSVTPGQSIVLYDGDVCLGGGIIS